MLTYHKRNMDNINKLADNTKALAMKWYDYLVANNIDILIYETIRTVEQQRENVRKGASQTMKSYHLVGQALDFVPVSNGQANWSGYGQANVKQAIAYAKSLGFEWGGDWKGFVDKPHLQYNYKGYGTDTFGKGATVNPSPSVPSPSIPQTETSKGAKYLVLPASADTWTVYHINRPPVKANSVNVAGVLAPSKFGGLTYEILGDGAEPNTYIIQTSSFGKVKIYATTSLGASFKGEASAPKPTPQPVAQKKNYLVLPATASSWRVYPTTKSPTKGNECGYLNPQKFGGLTYEILGNPQADVYIIQTANFGRVQIYASPSTGAKIISK